MGLGGSEEFSIRDLVLHYKTSGEVEPKEESYGHVILYCVQLSSCPRRLQETIRNEKNTRDHDFQSATQ